MGEVVERLHSHVVARAEQVSAAAVPDDEGEIAEQTAGAVRSPAPVGTKDESRVAGGLPEAQGGQQLVAVVQADVRHDRKPVVEDGLSCRRPVGARLQQAVAKADAARAPGRDAVGAAVADRLQHAVEIGRQRRAPVAVHHADDGAHSGSGPKSASGT